MQRGSSPELHSVGQRILEGRDEPIRGTRTVVHGGITRLRAVLAAGGPLVVAVPFHPSAAFCEREERWIRHGMSPLVSERDHSCSSSLRR
jgi:hypothetical protein